MIEFLKTNKQLIGLMLIFVLIGSFVPQVDWVLIPLCIILLIAKDRITDVFIVFTMVLFFADNWYHFLHDFSYIAKDVILLTLTVFYFFNTKKFTERSKLFIPFTIFLLWAFVLIEFSPIPFESFQRTLSFALSLIVVPNYFLAELKKNGEYFLRNLIWFYIFFLFLGIVLIFPFKEFVFPQLDRYRGLLGNANGIGTISILIVIIVSLARFHYPNLFTKHQLYFIYTVIIISVLLSDSRNSIFSIILFLFFQRFYKISYLTGFMIVVVTAIVSEFISENLVAIITSMGLGEYLRVDNLGTGGSRAVAWAFAWEEIQKNFYHGRGFGFDNYYFRINQDYLVTIGHKGGIHSSYFALWMNVGLIGLILFMIAYFSSFFKAASLNYLAIPAMFAIAFSISFEAWISASLSPFNLSFLLIITLLQLPKQHDPPAQENLNPVL